MDAGLRTAIPKIWRADFSATGLLPFSHKDRSTGVEHGLLCRAQQDTNGMQFHGPYGHRRKEYEVKFGK